MSRVSIHQPAFNGWLGYYQKIIWCEKFITLDNVQLEKNSFTNRNYIKLLDGKKSWLTIPLQMKGHMTKPIAEIEIDNRQSWKKKHLNTLRMNYSKAPYFHQAMTVISEIYQLQTDSFSEFAQHALEKTLDFFNIKRDLYLASSFKLENRNSELILELCQKLEATSYLSGVFGKGYLNEGAFMEKNIQVTYQAFLHPHYQQFKGEFLEGMGIFDFMLNAGPALEEVVCGY